MLGTTEGLHEVQRPVWSFNGFFSDRYFKQHQIPSVWSLVWIQTLVSQWTTIIPRGSLWLQQNQGNNSSPAPPCYFPMCHFCSKSLSRFSSVSLVAEREHLAQTLWSEGDSYTASADFLCVLFFTNESTLLFSCSPRGNQLTTTTWGVRQTLCLCSGKDHAEATLDRSEHTSPAFWSI